MNSDFVFLIVVDFLFWLIGIIALLFTRKVQELAIKYLHKRKFAKVFYLPYIKSKFYIPLTRLQGIICIILAIIILLAIYAKYYDPNAFRKFIYFESL